MQTFGAFLVSFLAASGLAAALPVASPAASAGKHSVPVVRNANYTPHGPLALAKAYNKFGKPMPADLAAAVASLAKRDTGSVTNTPVNGDVEYLCPVEIGTPAQTLALDFDTGSSDLWVFSTETTSSEVDGQTLYDPSKSSTAELVQGASWSITYGDGSSSSGNVYTDVVTIGGLTVQGQTVEPAQTVSSTFTSDTSSSGLVGLAWSSINTVTPNQATTFWDTASSETDANLFTADLKHNADGSYNFGYIDDTLHTGTINYTPVDNSQGFWGFTANGYAVGDGAPSGASIDGIADTGTTLLLLDDTVVQDYYSNVSGAQYDSSQGGYTFSCSAALPDFTFGVGSGSITVPGEFINFAAVDDSTCFGGLQSDDGIGFSIFGDVALKAAFVVFDAGNTQIGWASKNL